MSENIRESDWKIFREIRPLALARFCDRILSEVSRLAQDSSIGSHERYLLVFELIKQRDEEIADAFNDFRRYTAIRQLAVMHSRDMLTEGELARFSPEAQETVKFLSEMYRPKKRAGPKRK